MGNQRPLHVSRETDLFKLHFRALPTHHHRCPVNARNRLCRVNTHFPLLENKRLAQFHQNRNLCLSSYYHQRFWAGLGHYSFLVCTGILPGILLLISKGNNIGILIQWSLTIRNEGQKPGFLVWCHTAYSSMNLVHRINWNSIYRKMNFKKPLCPCTPFLFPYVYLKWNVFSPFHQVKYNIKNKTRP